MRDNPFQLVETKFSLTKLNSMQDLEFGPHIYYEFISVTANIALESFFRFGRCSSVFKASDGLYSLEWILSFTRVGQSNTNISQNVFIKSCA